MAENKIKSIFKGISINQVLNIVPMVLSVVAIVLSIIAISTRPNQGHRFAEAFKPNQVWDINKDNNHIDGNNKWPSGFGKRMQRNDQNRQDGGFRYQNETNRDQNKKQRPNVDDNKQNNNQNVENNGRQPIF